MAEGFGPRFKRLREKVDAWGKEYDERRAADRAFLERDKARSEKARAEWREHQARLKQRVKVYGRSGAKAEGRPTRGNGNGQTVTEVKKELPNSQSKQSKFTQNNAPNYAWTDYEAPTTSGYSDADLDAYAKGKSYGYLSSFDSANPLNKAWRKREEARRKERLKNRLIPRGGRQLPDAWGR